MCQGKILFEISWNISCIVNVSGEGANYCLIPRLLGVVFCIIIIVITRTVITQSSYHHAWINNPVPPDMVELDCRIRLTKSGSDTKRSLVTFGVFLSPHLWSNMCSKLFVSEIKYFLKLQNCSCTDIGIFWFFSSSKILEWQENQWHQIQGKI